MLRDKFNRTCTNYYTYSNTFTCLDSTCHVENSGCSNHTNTGCSNHTNSGCSNRTNTGCNDHSDTGYDNHSNYGYGNHSNYGYSDHSNTGYGNHSNTGYGNHSNYTNYENGYSCSTYANYINYVDATNPKLGGPMTLTWNSSASKYNRVSSDYIKEIRNNIKKIATEKQRNSVSTINVEESSGNSSNTVMSSNEKILSSSIEGIRSALNSLYSELNSESTNISISEHVKVSDIGSLKSAINTLAAKDLSGNYINYVNSSYDYNSQNTYANSSNIPKEDITYTDTGILSYINNYCSEYKKS